MLPAILLAAAAYANPTPTPDAVEERVRDILRQMTLDENLDYIGGVRGFYVRAVPRLGIPELKMSDGPVGVRNYGPSTAYAAGIALAASWDTDLAGKVGRALGRDARARGVHFLLGPGLNIYRAPQCGRNFEYFGEDPFLAGRMTAAYVRGLQSQGVAATLKHFACNNQENARGSVSVEADERTLHEIYLPAFRAGVQEGQACALMAAYNRIGGTYCSANDWLNNQVLKTQWGFQGLLMSDWGAAHDALGCATGGLDLEMPGAKHMNAKNLKPFLQEGKITEALIEDKVRRILRVAVRMGWLDRPQQDSSIPADDPETGAVALEEARSGIVLLKNERGVLPLDRTRIRRVVVMGPHAHPTPTGGGGSSYTRPFRAVSILAGITNTLGAGIDVARIPYQAAPSGEAMIGKAEINAGIRLRWGPERTAVSNALVDQVRGADVVLFCGGTREGEGADRAFEMPQQQSAAIEAVAAVHSNVVVVLVSGGGMDMAAWVDRVPAILHAWYPGQSGGQAIADILFGDVNPGGRLPVSLERNWADNAACSNYPGAQGQVLYKEGLFVGYRHFDKNNITPLFCFGHGLSYTTFRLSNMRAGAAGDSVQVSVDVANTGAREGSEVVQVYLTDRHAGMPRPVRELKAFRRVRLKSGEVANVTMALDRSAFACYDTASKSWRVTPGEFDLAVGSSSRDLPLRESVTVR